MSTVSGVGSRQPHLDDAHPPALSACFCPHRPRCSSCALYCRYLPALGEFHFFCPFIRAGNIHQLNLFLKRPPCSPQKSLTAQAHPRQRRRLPGQPAHYPRLQMYMSHPEPTPTAASSSSNRSPAFGHPLPTPLPSVLTHTGLESFQPYVPVQDQYFDHVLHDPSDLEDDDAVARRLRAHGKRRQRDERRYNVYRQAGELAYLMFAGSSDVLITLFTYFVAAECADVPNNQLSCLPKAGATFLQDQWITFLCASCQLVAS